LPEKFFFNEASQPAKLSNRQRGHLAELAFMGKAASLGLSIAKPCNEGERYDFIARVEEICWRIQIKSTFTKAVSRHHYRVKTSGGRSRAGHIPYSAAEIDFLVAYIYPEDVWYVLPSTLIEGRKSICVRPGWKKSPFEKYREAWDLLKPASPAAQLPQADLVM
jgi:hypothetical protein